MLMKKRIAIAICAFGLIVAACADPVGNDGATDEPSTSTSSPDVTTTVPSSSSTTTTIPSQTVDSDARVAPTERRDQIEAIASTYQAVAGGGTRRTVTTATGDGDYVISDAETGEIVVTYDARRLVRWNRLVSTTHIGAVGFDDPHLRDQTAVQSLVLTAAESKAATVVDRQGREVIEYSFSDEYDFDEWSVTTDFALGIDAETGMITQYGATQVSPPIDSQIEQPRSVPGDVSHIGLVTEAAFVGRADAATEYNDGYTLVPTLDAAEAAVGYPVDAPGWLPAGFELAQITINTGRNNTAILTYRLWMYRIDVVYMDSDPYDEGEDPFTGQSSVLGVTQNGFRIANGDTSVPSHAWGIIGEQSVTVSGGIGTGAIQSIAESLN